MNIAIGGLNLAKEASSITPATAVFGTVITLLTIIRVSFFTFFDGCPRPTRCQDTMANDQDYVELRLYCADICSALNRGMNGWRKTQRPKSVSIGYGKSTDDACRTSSTLASKPSPDRTLDLRTVAEIQRVFTKMNGRNAAVSRPFHSMNDKEAIAGWKADLNKVLRIFNASLACFASSCPR